MKINATCTARSISSGVVPSGVPAVASRRRDVRLSPLHASLIEQGSAWAAGTDAAYLGTAVLGTDVVPAPMPTPRKHHTFANLGIRTTSPPV